MPLDSLLSNRITIIREPTKGIVCDHWKGDDARLKDKVLDYRWRGTTFFFTNELAMQEAREKLGLPRMPAEDDSDDEEADFPDTPPDKEAIQAACAAEVVLNNLAIKPAPRGEWEDMPFFPFPTDPPGSQPEHRENIPRIGGMIARSRGPLTGVRLRLTLRLRKPSRKNGIDCVNLRPGMKIRYANGPKSVRKRAGRMNIYT